MQSDCLKLNCITLVWVYLCNRTDAQSSRIRAAIDNWSGPPGPWPTFRKVSSNCDPREARWVYLRRASGTFLERPASIIAQMLPDWSKFIPSPYFSLLLFSHIYDFCSLWGIEYIFQITLVQKNVRGAAILEFFWELCFETHIETRKIIICFALVMTLAA